MGQFYKLEEMLTNELDKIASEGKLSTSSLEVGSKAAHFLKSIKTIEAMEEAEDGASYDDYSMAGGNSYARGGGRGRGRNANRDSMGRYASERGGGYARRSYDQEGSYARGRDGYSGNKEHLMAEIEELKNKLENMEE